MYTPIVEVAYMSCPEFPIRLSGFSVDASILKSIGSILNFDYTIRRIQRDQPVALGALITLDMRRRKVSPIGGVLVMKYQSASATMNESLPLPVLSNL
jgi:hypothetical protein